MPSLQSGAPRPRPSCAPYLQDAGTKREGSHGHDANEPAKKARVSRASSRPIFNGPVSKEPVPVLHPQAYITDFPAEFEASQVHQLHLDSGLLEEDAPLSSKMLPSKDGHSRSCISRYNSEESLQRAIKSLSGMSFTTKNGYQKFVGASKAKPAAWMVDRGLASAPVVADKVKNDRPKELYPQAYISDIPVEFGEDDVNDLHMANGLDEEDLPVSVRLLPTQAGATTCCIARYKSEESLQRAISSLAGISVTTSHGVEKTVQARRAKPAGWMFEKGLAEAQPEVKPEATKSTQQDGPQALLPSAYISDIPKEYGRVEMHSLHLHNGVKGNELPVSIKMLPSKDGQTCCCIARYSTEESLQRAIECLSGITVTTESGVNKYVAVKKAKPASWMIEKGMAKQWDAGGNPPSQRQAPSQEGFNARMQWQQNQQQKQKGAPALYPQAYISDVPVEYGEQDIHRLHAECDIAEADLPISMKILPSKDRTGETCSCIARYKDEDSCYRAIMKLSGAKVRTRSGIEKVIAASEAKPAKWMVEKGVGNH